MKVDTKVDTGKKQLLHDMPQLFKFAILLFVLFAAVMAYERFDDFVERKPDGTYTLKKKRIEEVQKKLKEYEDEAEQYVLVAKTNGNYECKHCPQGAFFLYANEIWKVGTTVKGKNKRYDPKFFRRMNLRYIVEYQGDIKTALQKETTRIAKYPLLPENLSRPAKPKSGQQRYRIARPVGNLSDR